MEFDPNRPVPDLCTALDGARSSLENALHDNAAKIEQWFRAQWLAHEAPFYGSVDVRNAGFKIAPVDTNLYPGGFNNLSPETLPLAVLAAQAAVEKRCANAKNILLVPERHTRNTFYLQNVATLRDILTQGGFNVRLGTLAEDIIAPTEVIAANGTPLLLEPLVRVGNRLSVAGFDACLVLLNNDLSAGVPPILQGLSEQSLAPPLNAAWAVRKKSQHFAAYDKVITDFATAMNIDGWLLNPYFDSLGGLDFSTPSANEALQEKVAAVLSKTAQKYAEYGINEKPFVIVKADAGTYGMGIMKVADAAELASLNRKQRNKMAVVKEGLVVESVIIQEGVPTIEQVKGATAEPVVYMMDKAVVGGFYRINTERGRDENLNSAGMSFVPLPFARNCNLAPPSAERNERFYSYGVVGRLALLAASVELEMFA